MNNLNKGKAILYLTAIFLAGAVGGTVVGYTSGKRKGFPPAPRPSEMTRHIMARFQSQLDLTPEQMEKIQPLVEQTTANLDGIHRESWRQVSEGFKKLNQQIAEYLTEGQRKKLEALESERKERVRKQCGPRGSGESSKARDLRTLD
jgi:Spy/CpxP family protein refolding chaperone